MFTRRTVLLVLKAALSVALIVYVASRVDLGIVWLNLKTINPTLLTFAAVLLLVQILVGTARTAQIYYVGVFFNLCTPGGIFGDVVRVWHAHRAGLTLPAAINSVILDRLTVAFSLVLATASTQY